MTESGVPEGAIFEADLGGGWALYDVSDILPKNPKGGYPTREDGVGKKPRYLNRKRTKSDIKIVRVYNHHSGAKGRDGYAGLLASVKYSIRDKKRERKNGNEYIQKGWPGAPYTFWMCVEPDIDAEGRKVIYRCNKDEVRSYHTGNAANDHGLGLAWQGNLTTIEPSKDQYEGAERLFAYLHANHELAKRKPFSFHAEADEFGGKKKPTCPGPHVEAFVKDYRSRLTPVFFDDEETEPVVVKPPPRAVAQRPARRNRHPLARG